MKVENSESVARSLIELDPLYFRNKRTKEVVYDKTHDTGAALHRWVKSGDIKCIEMREPDGDWYDVDPSLIGVVMTTAIDILANTNKSAE